MPFPNVILIKRGFLNFDLNLYFEEQTNFLKDSGISCKNLDFPVPGPSARNGIGCNVLSCIFFNQAECLFSIESARSSKEDWRSEYTKYDPSESIKFGVFFSFSPKLLKGVSSNSRKFNHKDLIKKYF